MSHEESLIINHGEVLARLHKILLQTFWHMGEELHMHNRPPNSVSPMLEKIFGPFVNTGNLETMLAFSQRLTSRSAYTVGGLIGWSRMTHYLELKTSDQWEEKIVAFFTAKNPGISLRRNRWASRFVRLQSTLLLRAKGIISFPEFYDNKQIQALQKLLFIPENGLAEFDSIAEADACSRAIAYWLFVFRVEANRFLHTMAKPNLWCSQAFLTSIDFIGPRTSFYASVDQEAVESIRKAERYTLLESHDLYLYLQGMPLRYLSALLQCEHPKEVMFYCGLVIAKGLEVGELEEAIANRLYDQRARLFKEIPLLKSLSSGWYNLTLLNDIYCPALSLHRDPTTFSWWRKALLCKPD